MLFKRTVVGLVALVAVAAVSVGVTSGDANASPPTRTYHVTITNLTSGQPLSPPVAATHRPSEDLFSVGEYASDEIEAIAESGNETPAFNALNTSPKVTQAIDVGVPLTPSDTTVGSFTDTVEFDISARPGDRLSLATMLICTNDGFTGLNRANLPNSGSETFYLNAYDAGTEDNTQESADIVDPCSGLGPVALAGDPNGNDDAGVDTAPAQLIRMHPGIDGSGDLSQGTHGWTGPVVMVTVERVD